MIPHLLNVATTTSDQTEGLVVWSALKLIGFKNREIMEKYREKIESFKETSTNNDHVSGAQAVLDMLDGKRLVLLLNFLTQK